MKRDDKLFGARTAEEREAFEIEDLAFDAQLLVERMMRAKKVNQAELARRLGRSPAFISQLLSTKGANMTLKTLARIAHALSERITLELAGSARKQHIRADEPMAQLYLRAISTHARSKNWQNSTPVNENSTPRRVAA